MRPVIMIAPQVQFSKSARDGLTQEVSALLVGTVLEGAAIVVLPSDSYTTVFRETDSVTLRSE